MISKSAILAYKKGYRVKNGEVLNPKGDPLKIQYNNHYPRFSVYCPKKRGPITVKVHQLLAWQLFKKQALGSHVHIRHLDDNPFNITDSNIALGSPRDNWRDRAHRVLGKNRV
jgi:hypothetical protein